MEVEPMKDDEFLSIKSSLKEFSEVKLVFDNVTDK